jgi:hypothetical protein
MNDIATVAMIGQCHNLTSPPAPAWKPAPPPLPPGPSTAQPVVLLRAGVIGLGHCLVETKLQPQKMLLHAQEKPPPPGMLHAQAHTPVVLLLVAVTG